TYRRRSGERASVEDYCERFPNQSFRWLATLAAADSTGIATPERKSPAQSFELPNIARYDVLEELGRGGMGVVYKARHQELNRWVALKMIQSGAHARPEDLARFRTEAEAVARLHHAHIVQIYDIGEAAGLPYIALELLEGGSLAERCVGTPL